MDVQYAYKFVLKSDIDTVIIIKDNSNKLWKENGVLDIMQLDNMKFCPSDK